MHYRRAYFVYGGTIILRSQDTTLTWTWFIDPNIGQEEQDQIFEAAVSREEVPRIKRTEKTYKTNG